MPAHTVRTANDPLTNLKSLFLPNRMKPCRIIRGPFRGATLLLNPNASLRHILGLYEHELNSWLRKAIPRVDTVFDVGANYGYFSFGVMAAWIALRKAGTIVAFEPQVQAFECLMESRPLNGQGRIAFSAINRFVGRVDSADMVSLDRIVSEMPKSQRNQPTLIKIDVEGAELDVLEGAQSLVSDRSLFVIEAHSVELLEGVRKFLADRGHAFEVIYQRPLPVIGREHRDTENCWVVSKLSDGGDLA